MRIGRRFYIMAQVTLLPVAWAVFGFLALAVWTMDHSFAEHDIPVPLRTIQVPAAAAQLVAIGTALAGLVLVVVFILLAVRRLHAIGLTGWFLLLWPVLIALIPTSSDKADGVLPMAEVAFEAIMMMVPGTVGANSYGPEPAS